MTVAFNCVERSSNCNLNWSRDSYLENDGSLCAVTDAVHRLCTPPIIWSVNYGHNITSKDLKLQYQGPTHFRLVRLIWRGMLLDNSITYVFLSLWLMVFDCVFIPCIMKIKCWCYRTWLFLVLLYSVWVMVLHGNRATWLLTTASISVVTQAHVLISSHPFHFWDTRNEQQLVGRRGTKMYNKSKFIFAHV